MSTSAHGSKSEAGTEEVDGEGGITSTTTSMSCSTVGMGGSVRKKYVLRNGCFCHELWQAHYEATLFRRAWVRKITQDRHGKLLGDPRNEYIFFLGGEGGAFPLALCNEELRSLFILKRWWELKICQRGLKWNTVEYDGKNGTHLILVWDLKRTELNLKTRSNRFYGQKTEFLGSIKLTNSCLFRSLMNELK